MQTIITQKNHFIFVQLKHESLLKINCYYIIIIIERGRIFYQEMNYNFYQTFPTKPLLLT